MASIYTRARSPFFWVKWRDPATGRLRQESTGIHVAAAGALQLVNRRRAELEVRELSAPKVRQGERWETWARDYFETRYAGTGSLKNALRALVDGLAFFRDHGAIIPRLLTYDIARQFVTWRKSAKTLPAIHHNTAKLRLVYLTILASEAVRRGMADGNPFREVKCTRLPAKRKQEITAEDQRRIEQLLADAKPWMREQWLVLMRTGCRIAETLVPLDRIDEQRMTITFRLKGGRLHTAPLHPDLLPLIATARHEKRRTLVVVPPSYCAVWSGWFKMHGLPYSAHCTRVTVITRLLRANYSPAKVCALIGHSEEINVIYRRLTAPDVAELLTVLS